MVDTSHDDVHRFQGFLCIGVFKTRLYQLYVDFGVDQHAEIP